MTFIAGWVGFLTESNTLEFLDNIKQESVTKYGINPSIEANRFMACAMVDGKILEDSENYFIAIIGGQNAEIENKHFTEELIKGYEQGKNFLSTLRGGFIFLIVDYKRKKLLIALDPIGRKSLYYSKANHGLVFGSTADAVVRHKQISNEISSQSIYDYVYFHQCPSPNTIYRDINKLEGGEVLIYESEKITIERYWRPQFSETMNESIESAGEKLQHKIFDAVKKSVGKSDYTGAFLSGGLDSSTVAGALSKVFPGKAKTFSIGFPVESYNEISFARIAVDHFKTIQHEYFITPEDTVSAIPKIAAYFDEPFGNSSALAAYYCAKMAKEEGVNVLLAGDGGDEIFAGNERYSKQLLFEYYQKIPPLLQKYLRTGFYNMPDFLLKNKILFKAKRYVEQAETPLPDRLEDYNFLHRHQLNDIFQKDYLQQVRTTRPLESLRECYKLPYQAGVLNRMLYMDWKTTLHDNDLVKVNRMCEMAGVSVEYPLLDQDIVEFSCRIPSALKMKNRQLRWFYKESMKGFLPEQILNKSKHGFGLPFGIWLKDHQLLNELAYDSLNNLKKRDYFRPDFIDHTISMHQRIHAPYYGELIWVLMMLELWLNSRR